jgi:hypothetical protein
MDKRDDYEAFSGLLGEERRRLSGRRGLLEALKRELEKDEDALDPVLAENLVKGLYETEGLTPLRVTERETEGFIARVRREGRRGKRERGEARTKRARSRGSRFAARCAAAACFVILFAFSVNYVTALASGACLPEKAGIRICCETRYCPCRIEAEGNAVPEGH